MKVFHPYVKVQETDIKAGDVIISQTHWDNEEFNRTVILMLQHDERGSVGIILNRQSNLKVGDVIPDLSFSHDLYYGGPCGINKIGFIHSIKNLSQSIRISGGIYWGGNVYQLQHLLANDLADPGELRFFAGLVEWAPGELADEITNKHWWTDDLIMEELLYIENSSLWAYKLINRENLYGLLHEVPDPCLN